MKKFTESLGIEHCDIEDIDMSSLVFTNDPLILKEEALKRNSENVQCPKCGVQGNRPNMMRWHFDKCKTILKNCKQCGQVIPRQGIKDHLYKQKHYCNQECYMESKKGINPIEMTSEIKKKISDSRKKYYDNLKLRKI